MVMPRSLREASTKVVRYSGVVTSTRSVSGGMSNITSHSSAYNVVRVMPRSMPGR